MEADRSALYVICIDDADAVAAALPLLLLVAPLLLLLLLLNVICRGGGWESEVECLIGN